MKFSPLHDSQSSFCYQNYLGIPTNHQIFFMAVFTKKSVKTVKTSDYAGILQLLDS
jgi:hypothetical protein